MTRLSIATTSIPGDLPTKLETIAAAGFSGVELNEPDLTGFSGAARDVAQQATELGLSFEIFQPFHAPSQAILQSRETVEIPQSSIPDPLPVSRHRVQRQRTRSDQAR